MPPRYEGRWRSDNDVYAQKTVRLTIASFSAVPILTTSLPDGKVSEDDVNYAYESLILYLQEERDSKKDNCLKNNRFVNLLIDEYNEKKEEDIILGRIHR